MTRQIKPVYLFLLILLFSGCAPFHPPAVHQAEILIHDPAVAYGTLANGFGYILVNNRTPENHIRMHLDVFAGSVHETDSQQGLAHYLEHMVFNGSTHFKPGELVRYFQSIGMDFGADANAHTGFYNTVYDLDLPDNSRETIRDGLLVFDDYARGALLLEEEIDRERGIILAEMRDRDSVSYRTLKATLRFELPGSILNRRHPIGIESVIRQAGREELKAFYDTWYRPDNMVLIAVGDFDVQELTALIRKQFDDFRARPAPQGIVPDNHWEPHAGVSAFYHHESEAGDTEITIETLTREAFTPETVHEYQEKIKARLANMILNNRLARLLRSGQPPFSDAGAFSGTFLHHVKLASISATSVTNQWQDTLEIMENTLRQALEFGFSRQELDQVRSDMLSSLDSEVKKAATRKSRDIAGMILNQLNNRRLILSPAQEQQILAPVIETLTGDDIHQAFKTAWSAPHRLITVTGKAEIAAVDGNTPETRIIDVFENSRKGEVVAYEPTAAGAFPYLPVPETRGKIVDDQFHDDLGIRKIAWDNHTCLNLKYTRFRENEIGFTVMFGKGRQSEPVDRPGLSLLAGTVIRNSGLGQMPHDEMEQALAGHDIHYRFDIRDDCLAFSGSAGKNEIGRLFELIRHFIMDPGIREDVLDYSRKQYQESYLNTIRTVEGVMAIKGNAFLAGDDTRFTIPEPDRINQYTIDDIRSWLLPYFNGSPVEVSVVGDFDQDELIRSAELLIGSLPPRQPDEDRDTGRAPPQFPEQKNAAFTVETKIDKSLVEVVFPTDDFWNIEQTRQLLVLARVFSERLRQTIREKLGDAYSPYVYNDASLAYDGYGLMHAVVSAAPDKSRSVADEIEKISRDLYENGVTDQELDLAKKPLINQLIQLQNRNQYWLNSVLAGSTFHPDRLDWARNFIEGYEQITPADIGRVAQKFLLPENRIAIFIDPVPEQQ